MAAPNHLYEVCLRWTPLYTQPSTFSTSARRLTRGRRFIGRPLRRAWIQLASGGYVRQQAMRDLGECTVTSERMQQAVDRFSAAAQGNTADLPVATGDLLEALAATAQQLVTACVTVLMERQDEQAQRLDLLQRHIEAVDVRLDELDGSRTRSVGE